MDTPRPIRTAHARMDLQHDVTMLLQFTPPAAAASSDTTLLVHCRVEGSDATSGGTPISLTVVNAQEARRRFAELADGGTVHVPLRPTFFAARFGLVTDRFGVSWVIAVPAPAPMPDC